ncbi:hypothetical protein X975_19704, partial [Stegodyphus mimosarum]
ENLDYEQTETVASTPVTSSIPRQAASNRQNRNRRQREFPVERAARHFAEFQKEQAEITKELTQTVKAQTEAIKAQTEAIVSMSSVLEKLVAKLA